MRIPHYLTHRKSGYSFRLVVPVSLRPWVGVAVVKKALKTHNKATAQAWALVLSAKYAQTFDELRGLAMAGKLPNPDEIARTLSQGNGKTWEVTLPNGIKIKTDNTEEDHKRGLEALALLSGQEVGEKPEIETKAKNEASGGIGIGELARKYLLSIGQSHIPKTISIKRTAILSFVQWRKPKTPCNECTRIDIAEWIQTLRSHGLATPTLANKSSYLKDFFEFCIRSGHYTGDNPAEKQVTYKKNEKRLRRKEGYEAFTVDELKTLFGAEFQKQKDSLKWGMWLGIYTGARISEIGQLKIEDFIEEKGFWWLRITDQESGQSLKNEASRRNIPLHPRLKELGIIDRINKLKKEGESQFFPGVKTDGINGAGNFLSKSFGYYKKKIGFKSRKKSFHSFRKNVVQKMQDGRIPAEYRARYVGHETKGEHFEAYSRSIEPKELAAVIFPVLKFSV